MAHGAVSGGTARALIQPQPVPAARGMRASWLAGTTPASPPPSDYPDRIDPPAGPVTAWHL